MSDVIEMTAATQYCNQDGKEDFGDFVRNEDEEMDLERLPSPGKDLIKREPQMSSIPSALET